MPNFENSVLPEHLLGGIKTAPEIPDKTWRLDLANGRVLGEVDGLEAVHQSAGMALLSVRFKTLAFTPQYGSEIWDIIAWDDASDELIESMIDFAVRDALSRDARITSIGNIDITLTDDNAHVIVDIYTTYGKTTLEVDYVRR